MENDPLNTLEIEFSGQNKVNALYHKGSEQMSLTYKDRCGDQATTFEFNVHSDFDSLNSEMQLFASEALKAAAICEERNLKIMKDMISSGVKEVYPVVIDERTV